MSNQNTDTAVREAAREVGDIYLHGYGDADAESARKQIEAIISRHLSAQPASSERLCMACAEGDHRNCISATVQTRRCGCYCNDPAQPKQSNGKTDVENIVDWLNHRCSFTPPCGNCTYCRVARTIPWFDSGNTVQPTTDNRVAEQLYEALKLAFEWLAGFPHQGTASTFDLTTASEVYSQLHTAISAYEKQKSMAEYNRLWKQDIATARLEVLAESLITFLTLFGKDCPNCPNQGWYADGPTDDPEQVQCQFCCCEPLSEFNIKTKFEKATEQSGEKQ